MRSKYQVNQSEQGRQARTFRGRTYASQAECRYAKQLATLVQTGDVDWWLRQPGFDLGEDVRYHADFLVASDQGVYAVDVKGYETAGFKRIKRLWLNYGRLPLSIVQRGRTIEVIEGATHANGR